MAKADRVIFFSPKTMAKAQTATSEGEETRTSIKSYKLFHPL
jgi:hypothetical protein